MSFGDRYLSHGEIFHKPPNINLIILYDFIRLLHSKANKPSLSCLSSYLICCISGNVLVNLLCTHSNVIASFLQYGNQNLPYHFSCCKNKVVYSCINQSLCSCFFYASAIEGKYPLCLLYTIYICCLDMDTVPC